MIKLSKTAIETYQTCGAKYKFHYIDRYRSKLQDSPLFFGSALDEALNCLLLTKKRELTDKELEYLAKDPKELFLEKFQFIKVLDEVVDIRFSELARYSNSDLDLSIFGPEDYDYVISNNPVKDIFGIKTSEELIKFVNKCEDKRKNKELLPINEFKLFNLINWRSLYKKGIYLIDEYNKNIMPEIKEVHEIQKLVHLPSSTGDYITGYIDFIATFNDGVKRVMDNKTSSSRYTQDNIKESLQLSIYTEFESNANCGFAVLEKKFRKKEPRARSELVLGTIEEAQLQKHFSDIENAFEGIKNKVYVKNTNSCFIYGKPCVFYELCNNNDASKLTKKD